MRSLASMTPRCHGIIERTAVRSKETSLAGDRVPLVHLPRGRQSNTHPGGFITDERNGRVGGGGERRRSREKSAEARGEKARGEVTRGYDVPAERGPAFCGAPMRDEERDVATVTEVPSIKRRGWPTDGQKDRADHRRRGRGLLYGSKRPGSHHGHGHCEIRGRSLRGTFCLSPSLSLSASRVSRSTYLLTYGSKREVAAGTKGTRNKIDARGTPRKAWSVDKIASS